MPTLGNAIPSKHIYYFIMDVLIHSVLFQAYKIWYLLRNLTADKTALEWCMCTCFHISVFINSPSPAFLVSTYAAESQGH